MSALALVPSAHALKVMAARGVMWGEVVSTVSRAEVIDHHDGRSRYFRGALCVVVADADSTVVTVLLRASHQWTDADARRRGTPV